MSSYCIWEIFQSPNHSEEALGNLQTWQTPLALGPFPFPGLFLTSHFAWLTPFPLLSSFILPHLFISGYLVHFPVILMIVCLLEIAPVFPSKPKLGVVRTEWGHCGQLSAQHIAVSYLLSISFHRFQKSKEVSNGRTWIFRIKALSFITHSTLNTSLFF